MGALAVISSPRESQDQGRINLRWGPEKMKKVQFYRRFAAFLLQKVEKVLRKIAGCYIKEFSQTFACFLQQFCESRSTNWVNKTQNTWLKSCKKTKVGSTIRNIFKLVPSSGFWKHFWVYRFSTRFFCNRFLKIRRFKTKKSRELLIF